jgi:hypothetical protein
MQACILTFERINFREAKLMRIEVSACGVYSFTFYGSWSPCKRFLALMTVSALLVSPYYSL